MSLAYFPTKSSDFQVGRVHVNAVTMTAEGNDWSFRGGVIIFFPLTGVHSDTRIIFCETDAKQGWNVQFTQNTGLIVLFI